MSLFGAGSFASRALDFGVNAPFEDALAIFALPADLGTLLADWPALSVGVGSLGSVSSVVGMGMPELLAFDISGQLATFDALGVADEGSQLCTGGRGGAFTKEPPPSPARVASACSASSANSSRQESAQPSANSVNCCRLASRRPNE